MLISKVVYDEFVRFREQDRHSSFSYDKVKDLSMERKIQEIRKLNNNYSW